MLLKLKSNRVKFFNVNTYTLRDDLHTISYLWEDHVYVQLVEMQRVSLLR